MNKSIINELSEQEQEAFLSMYFDVSRGNYLYPEIEGRMNLKKLTKQFSRTKPNKYGKFIVYQRVDSRMLKDRSYNPKKWFCTYAYLMQDNRTKNMFTTKYIGEGNLRRYQAHIRLGKGITNKGLKEAQRHTNFVKIPLVVTRSQKVCLVAEQYLLHRFGMSHKGGQLFNRYFCIKKLKTIQ